MNPLDLFKDWLSDVPTASDFACLAGHWSSFESSKSNRYIAYSVVGGSSPRELNTRMPQIGVTLVGSKDDSLAAISTLAENILAYAQLTPPSCALVAVNVLGDVIGPRQTTGGRPLLTLTLQLIT